MNMLLRTCMRQFRRFVETSATSKSKLFAEPLASRALIRVQGKEVVPFLQGLITNDIHHLHDGSSSMFTMFLNNAGRVLYDSIIYKTPWTDTFLIECDREASSELRRHLRLYRVRKKIDIDCINSEYTPWVVYNTAESVEASNNLSTEGYDESTNLIYSADPRVKHLGVRIIQPQSNELKDLAKLFPSSTLEQPGACNYISHRYSYGVGEGIIDHPPGKCFPLEANCDFLNGVSFHKGCYVGQELTARVYHTGIVRKRLMPLKLTSDLDTTAATVQTQAGAVVGTVRGTSHRNALALLRVEQVLKAQDLMIDGQLCTVSKPAWWPSELPNTQSMRRD